MAWLQTLKYDNVTATSAAAAAVTAGAALDLEGELYHRIAQTVGYSFPHIGQVISVRCGTHQTPPSSSSSSDFRHQLSIDTSLRLHIKVFRTGRIQVTGLREPSEEAARRVIRSVWRHLAQRSVASDLAADVRITLVFATFKLGFELDRTVLFRLLKRDWSPLCSFEPAAHPAVRLQFFHGIRAIDGICRCPTRHCRLALTAAQRRDRPCHKVTLMVFRTGSVVVTGARSAEQVVAATTFIGRWITERRAVLLKQSSSS